MDGLADRMSRDEVRRNAAQSLEFYGRHFLRILDKLGVIVPFEMNSAQRIVHEKVEDMLRRKGYVRVFVVKGRQQGMCLDPATLVLTASLRWVPIADLSAGDVLVSCGERSDDATSRVRTAEVQKVWTTRREALRITLDDGRSVICSAEHRWLSRKEGADADWRSVAGSGHWPDGRDALRVGDDIRAVTGSPRSGATPDERLIDAPWRGGRGIPDHGWRRIVSIEPLGVRDLVDIQTSTGTFVAEGLASHNSTYVQARFRHKMKFRMGIKAYTVAHELKSTQNLFKIAKRYQEGEPEWDRPIVGASNANELWLSKLDSRLEVVTAGTGDVGRSGTAQLLHASEAAYWPSPENTWAALGQVVPSGEGVMHGTEVIVETTGNGPNEFRDRIYRALAGESEYEVVFVPWFMQSEYRLKVLDGFALSADRDEETGFSEADVAELYGLSLEQMAWRRNKIASDFNGSVVRFMREYPATLNEAFTASGVASYLPMRDVVRAQQTLLPGTGRIVVGCDPAVADDGDSCGLAVRQGRRVHMIKGYKGKTGPQIAAMLRAIIEKHRGTPGGVVVMLDVGGLGIVIYQILVDQGYEDFVQAVNFGSTADDEEQFANKKAELYTRGRDFLKSGASIPEGAMILAEFSSTGSTEDTKGRIAIESKKSVKRRFGRSPDMLEAFVLTFELPSVVGRARREAPIDDGSRTVDQYFLD